MHFKLFFAIFFVVFQTRAQPPLFTPRKFLVTKPRSIVRSSTTTTLEPFVEEKRYGEFQCPLPEVKWLKDYQRSVNFYCFQFVKILITPTFGSSSWLSPASKLLKFFWLFSSSPLSKYRALCLFYVLLRLNS